MSDKGQELAGGYVAIRGDASQLKRDVKDAAQSLQSLGPAANQAANSVSQAAGRMGASLRSAVGSFSAYVPGGGIMSSMASALGGVGGTAAGIGVGMAGAAVYASGAANELQVGLAESAMSARQGAVNALYSVQNMFRSAPAGGARSYELTQKVMAYGAEITERQRQNAAEVNAKLGYERVVDMPQSVSEFGLNESNVVPFIANRLVRNLQSLNLFRESSDERAARGEQEIAAMTASQMKMAKLKAVARFQDLNEQTEGMIDSASNTWQNIGSSTEEAADRNAQVFKRMLDVMQRIDSNTRGQ